MFSHNTSRKSIDTASRLVFPIRPGHPEVSSVSMNHDTTDTIRFSFILGTSLPSLIRSTQSSLASHLPCLVLTNEIVDLLTAKYLCTYVHSMLCICLPNNEKAESKCGVMRLPCASFNYVLGTVYCVLCIVYCVLCTVYLYVILE
jgi:hypothetical protein